jgi:hypothetical protein
MAFYFSHGRFRQDVDLLFVTSPILALAEFNARAWQGQRGGQKIRGAVFLTPSRFRSWNLLCLLFLWCTCSSAQDLFRKKLTKLDDFRNADFAAAV